MDSLEGDGKIENFNFLREGFQGGGSGIFREYRCPIVFFQFAQAFYPEC